MKKLRIAALVLAIIMLTLTMAACGSKTEKVTVNCKVSVMINGEYILDNYPYAVTGPVDNPPTILQATLEALQTLEYAASADETGLTLQSVTYEGVEYVGPKSDGTNMYFWTYTIDGVEPAANSGKAGNRAIEEGQSICYIYNVESLEELASKAE